MRLALSNIAWDIAEDHAVSELLKKYKIDAIDVAPRKYFENPEKTTEQEISNVKNWWEKRGVEITGMQALLFGTNGLNLFSETPIQNKMLAYLEHICKIGSGLGAQCLVFGSPKNRDRTGLSDCEATEIAIVFFRKLADIADKFKVTICLEPNPTCYGSNFMTTSSETALLIQQIDRPSIKMQLDTGALTINAENISAILTDNAKLIGHIHASEPNLVTLGCGATDHVAVRQALQKHLPKHVVSIEMLASKNKSHLEAIEAALNAATLAYRTSM